MVELAFVQQVTLLSTILLGFSFPVVSQLATYNQGEKTNGNTFVATSLVAFIMCAAAMLTSTFIGLALTLILSYYQSQSQPLPQHAINTIDALADMWRWPLSIGIITFLVAFALLGWIRSWIVGILATAATLGAFIVIFIVWGMISRI